MAWYVARITSDDRGFAVTFPDAPSIRIVRDTLEEAVELGAQALCAELGSWRAKGISCGEPTLMSAMPRDGEDVSYALVEIADAVEAAAPNANLRAFRSETPAAFSARAR